jgi:hypothetical protein
MATIGIEYIDRFSHVRAAGGVKGGAQDLTSPYYIATWFGARLAEAGHDQRIFHANLGVAERHMRADSRRFGA